MAISQAYVDQARKMLNGAYNAKVQAYKNALNDTVTGYNNQVGSTNLDYDNQVKNNTANTLGSENNFSNANLARGLGRSTIASSGVQGIALQGKDAENTINTNRQNALNNINNNIQLANKNYNNNLAALNAQNESDVLNQALQLQAAAEAKAAAEVKAAAAKKAAAYSRSRSSKSSDTQSMYNAIGQYGKNGTASGFIEANKQAIISNLGESAYNTMKKKAIAADDAFYKSAAGQAKRTSYIQSVMRNKKSLNMDRGY